MIISSRFAKLFYSSMTLLLAIIGAIACFAPSADITTTTALTSQIAIAFWLAAALNLVCLKHTGAATPLYFLLLVFTFAMALSQTLTSDYQWWLWLPVVLYVLPLIGKLFARLPSSTKGSHNELEGTVKWFNSKKGFGFIVTEDDSEYFVHFKALKNGNRYQLKNGAAVRFQLRDTDRGQQAINVFIL